MTLEKLFGFWTAAGVVLGLLLFGVIAAFRETFAVAGEFGDMPGVGGRGIGMVLVPGIGVGWACFAVASRLTDDAGVRRWLPLAVCGVVGFGVAVVLERAALDVEAGGVGVLMAPTVLAVAAYGVTVGVREWLDA